MWRRSDTATLAILGPLAFCFAFSLDIYIPVVPQLVNFFHTTPQHMQLTLSLFMVFLGVGQLVWGPLSDHVGRRQVALLSLAIYMVGSLICMAAYSVNMLIVGRCVQAFGACGLMVVAMAVIRDAYDKRASARMYSLMNGMISASPLFAPLIGGYLVTWFNWRAPFLFLTIFGGVMVLVVAKYLDESLPVERRIKFDVGVLRHYLTILSNLQFVVYTVVVSSGVICFFTFFSLSPYLIIKELHVAVENFGYYFGVLGVVFLIGSILSSIVAPRVGIYRTVALGAGLLLMGGLIMTVWVLVAGLTAMNFVLPMFLVGFGGAFMVGAGAAGALAPFGNMAGTAAAVLGCSEFLISGVIGAVVLHYKTHTSMPLAITILVVGILCLVLVLPLRQKITRY